jgi:hypothetical protein
MGDARLDKPIQDVILHFASFLCCLLKELSGQSPVGTETEPANLFFPSSDF